MVPSGRGHALAIANGAEAADEFSDDEAVSGARRRRRIGRGGNHGAESGVEVVEHNRLVAIVVERKVRDGIEVAVHLGENVSFHLGRRESERWSLDYG